MDKVSSPITSKSRELNLAPDLRNIKNIGLDYKDPCRLWCNENGYATYKAEYAVFSSLIEWMVKGRRLAPHATSERIVTGALDGVRGGNSTSGVSHCKGGLKLRAVEGHREREGFEMKQFILAVALVAMQYTVNSGDTLQSIAEQCCQGDDPRQVVEFREGIRELNYGVIGESEVWAGLVLEINWWE
jgi:hypothetical protein